VPRLLEPGQDFSPKPLHKFIRARMLMGELLDDLSEYRERLGSETVARFSRDRREVTFYARIIEQPPLARWELIYGDALHNYRAALDAFAWELAHLDGAQPSDPRGVYFPIFSDRDRWETERTTRLNSVPAEILDRLEAVQPFVEEPVEEGIGLYLHRLDIQDKHRGEIVLDLKARDKVSFAMMTKQRDARLEDGAGDDFEWLGPDETVRDNLPVIRIGSRSPYEMAGIEKLPLVVLLVDKAKEYDALEFARLIDWQVAASFEIVCRGERSDGFDWLKSVGIDA
jgi:hypothetical protein